MKKSSPPQWLNNYQGTHYPKNWKKLTKAEQRAWRREARKKSKGLSKWWNRCHEESKKLRQLARRTPVYQRTILNLDPEIQNPGPSFRYFHWNVLSFNCCSPKSFPKVEPDFLTDGYRKPMLRKELLQYNPDIISL